jgi:hypothetical protein
LSSRAEDEEGVDEGEEVQCRRREEVREVTMAAEEPRPVLWTFRIVQLSGANGTGAESWQGRYRQLACLL